MTDAPPTAPVILALTMGDPCGIGPEIIVKAFRAGDLNDAVVVGDVEVMRRAGAPLVAWVEHPDDLATLPAHGGEAVSPVVVGHTKTGENEDIRGLLNAGHRKHSVVGRCVVLTFPPRRPVAT